jgi:hypothetical protein
MDDHNFSIPHYEALKQAIKPVCPGCLDMNSSIFDWRAVRWAGFYPNLDPQKIVDGVRNHCTSCTMINAAFHSIGLDLDTMHDPRCLSLYSRGQNGGLLAKASHDQKCSNVELYTVEGEFFPSCFNPLSSYAFYMGSTQP